MNCSGHRPALRQPLTKIPLPSVLCTDATDHGHKRTLTNFSGRALAHNNEYYTSIATRRKHHRPYLSHISPLVLYIHQNRKHAGRGATCPQRRTVITRRYKDSKETDSSEDKCRQLGQVPQGREGVRNLFNRYIPRAFLPPIPLGNSELCQKFTVTNIFQM